MRDIWDKETVDIEEINRRVQRSPGELIWESEEYYRGQIEAIAKRIAGDTEHCRLILLTGPSASGKTTSAKLLSERLEERRVKTHVVSFDNFFLNRDQVKLLPDGRPDFEAVEALDIPLIHQCFTQLLLEGECRIPIFNFHTGKRQEEAIPLQAGPKDVVIAEGIHALNPVMLPPKLQDNTFKIYACVQREFAKEGEVAVTSKQVRFLRRILRDYYHRSASPEYTMFLWDNVCLGEEKYIKPFKQYADVILDTMHDYEVCVVKDCLRFVLHKTKKREENEEALATLKQCLDHFCGLGKGAVPESSMLQEFVS